jgi:hypothetical protein
LHIHGTPRRWSLAGTVWVRPAARRRDGWRVLDHHFPYSDIRLAPGHALRVPVDPGGGVLATRPPRPKRDTAERPTDVAARDQAWVVLRRELSNSQFRQLVRLSWESFPASAAVPQDVPGKPTVTAAPVAGRVCDTGMRMLPHATEMIIAYSDSDRTLTYQATGMPAYVGVARNRWTITAVDQQRTQAAFEAVFAPAGFSVACWPGGSWSRSAAPAGTSWGT